MDAPKQAAYAVDGASGASTATATIDRNQIPQLESAYVGWTAYDEDHSTDAVTIDVYVAVTKKAEDDYKGSASRLARLAVDTANRGFCLFVRVSHSCRPESAGSCLFHSYRT